MPLIYIMYKNIKLSALILFLAAFFCLPGAFAQVKKKRHLSKRDSLRASILSRDSLMRTFKRSDTSLNGLLQKVEAYTSVFNQIKSNLSRELDTVSISKQLPLYEKRIVTIKNMIDNDQSSTLRYLYAIRDFLTHIDDNLDDWSTTLTAINSKLIQNQTDLTQMSADSAFKTVPSDSSLRVVFLKQKFAIEKRGRSLDSVNRKLMLKIGLMQNRVAAISIAIIDEHDQIDAKIRNFSIKAMSCEYNYIWDMNGARGKSFGDALDKTVTMNSKLFGFFLGRDILIHFCAALLFLLFFSWIFANRRKIMRTKNTPLEILGQTKYIAKYPLISAILLTAAIAPNFYDHPPMVFLEAIFILLMLAILVLVKLTQTKPVFNYLLQLFGLTLLYSASNLFIEVSHVDRVCVLLLAVVCTGISWRFLQHLKKTPEDYFPFCRPILRVFIGLQGVSFLCNAFGRFSIAKIIGVTATYNLWLAIGLYLLVQIMMESLFLQLEANKSDSGISSYLDFKVLQKKLRSLLNILGVCLWLVVLTQNLSVEDAVFDYLSDFLTESHKLGATGTAFSIGSVIIFVAVLWLSSLVARVISYFYDFADQHKGEPLFKKKARTSILLVRLGVFAVGFCLAVAASGFPLDKITIIISAFGIGIGFGLQNIVNNLVSGLILAFEKPVQIGDIIEVDSRSGTIREIGIRSSKIATADGAEVIIPNGDLISHHVINWTLSNSNRRVELIIGVGYGSDVEKVKQLLKDLLCNRTDIMTEPGPVVFLHNLNESSVDFRVLFWAADISTWQELKSRILADIYITFNKEGISIPYPQSDVHVYLPENTKPEDVAGTSEQEEVKEPVTKGSDGGKELELPEDEGQGGDKK